MALPPGLILRAGTPGDAPFIQRVHEESIRGLGTRCYSRAEVESWAAGLKPQRYVQAMTQGDERFLLVEPEGGGGWLAAFCSFGADRIDNLYVHPDWARRGVAWANSFWPRPRRRSAKPAMARFASWPRWWAGPSTRSGAIGS